MPHFTSKFNRKTLLTISTILLISLLLSLSLINCEGCNQTIETTKTEFITNIIKIYSTNNSVKELLSGGNVHVATYGIYFSNPYSKRLLITNFDFDPFVIRDVVGSLIGSNLQGDFYSLTTNSSGEVTGSNLTLAGVVLPSISVTNLMATNDQVGIITQFTTIASDVNDSSGYGLDTDDTYLYLPSATNIAIYRTSDYGFERWLSPTNNDFTNLISAVAVDSSNIYVLLKAKVYSSVHLKVFSKTNYAYLRQITIGFSANRLKERGEYLLLGTEDSANRFKSNREFKIYFKSTLTKKSNFISPYYLNSPACIIDDKEYIYVLDSLRADVQTFDFDERESSVTYQHKFGSRFGSLSNSNTLGEEPYPHYNWAPQAAYIQYGTIEGNRFYIFQFNRIFKTRLKYLTVLDKSVLLYSLTNTNTKNEERINHDNYRGGSRVKIEYI